MKWLFKWLFRLFLLAVVLVVILLLSLNSILRVVAGTPHPRADRHGRGNRKIFARPRRADGEIQNLRLFNPPSFGGTPFLNIPEIHVEYDRAALARHEIHITLMRFNLGELDIVKNRGRPDEYLCARRPRCRQKMPAAARRTSNGKPATTSKALTC